MNALFLFGSLVLLGQDADFVGRGPTSENVFVGISPSIFISVLRMTALPALLEPVKLPALLRDWPAERALFFADETGGVPAFDAMRARPGPAAILIGPEGGFDPEEREQVRAHPQAIGMALGPRILRAETAAAAATALWMAAAGDW